MPDQANKQQKKDEPQRIKLTARLTANAYNAITEIQRLERTKTGHALPLWKVIDAAIIFYAKAHGIKPAKYE